MSFTSKVIKSRNQLIQLVSGKYDDRPAWWIVKIDPQKLEIFKIKLPQGGYDLEDFGEILAKGWGESPPESVIKQLEDKYS